MVYFHAKLYRMISWVLPWKFVISTYFSLELNFKRIVFTFPIQASKSKTIFLSTTSTFWAKHLKLISVLWTTWLQKMENRPKAVHEADVTRWSRVWKLDFGNAVLFGQWHSPKTSEVRIRTLFNGSNDPNSSCHDVWDEKITHDEHFNLLAESCEFSIRTCTTTTRDLQLYQWKDSLCRFCLYLCPSSKIISRKL